MGRKDERMSQESHRNQSGVAHQVLRLARQGDTLRLLRGNEAFEVDSELPDPLRALLDRLDAAQPSGSEDAANQNDGNGAGDRRNRA